MDLLGLQSVFNNGIILQYGFHDHGYNQDIFKDVITFPISYYNVIIVIITQKDVAQVGVTPTVVTGTSFTAWAWPGYGNSYTQRYSNWISIGY